MASLRLLLVAALAAAGAHAFVPVAPNFRVQRPASRGAVAVTMLTDAEQAYLKAKAAAEAKRKAAEAALAAAEQILQGLISGHSDPDAKGQDSGPTMYDNDDDDFEEDDE